MGRREREQDGAVWEQSGGPRTPPGARPGTLLCDSLYSLQPQARVGRVLAADWGCGASKGRSSGATVKRRVGDGSWLGPLGGVTPGAPQTLRQPPQPILTQEQVSEENVTPWVLRKPCPSPGLSFPIGKAEGGKPRLGTGFPPEGGELERGPPGVLGSGPECGAPSESPATANWAPATTGAQHRASV